MTTRIAALRSDPLDALKPLLASRWTWCIAAALFVAMRDLGQAQLLTSLGDTDDATRLVQVRTWLASGNWFDMTLHRFGGPTPLVSHWSRLVDLPIGLLLVIFGSVLSPEHAELAVRIAWPTILMTLLLRMLVREAELRGGATAGVLALVLAVTTVTGLYQFKLGRIDHHNVMILCTLSGFLMLARNLSQQTPAYLAGGLLGAALAVGYEPLMLIAPAVATLGLIAAFRIELLTTASTLAIALAATLAATLVLTTEPSLWLAAPCDALGVNLVLLTTAGAAGLWIVSRHGRDWPLAIRIGALIAAASAGGALYVGSNAQCLQGPFGQVSREAVELWLVTVWETKGIVEMMAYQPAAMCLYLAFAAVALWASAVRYRATRSVDAAAVLGLMLLAAGAAFSTTKFIPYSSFLSVIALGLFIAEFKGGGQLSPLAARLLGATVMNQSTLALVVGVALAAGGTSKDALDGAALKDTDQCRTTPVIRSLAKLPKGFVVASVDFGPYIVALTPHDVLAAPYHRIDGAIVESFRIMRASPAVAEQKLRALNADYLVECVPPTKPGERTRLEEGVTRDSLIGRLTFGDSVPFLEELHNVTSEPSVRVWRVKPRAE